MLSDVQLNLRTVEDDRGIWTTYYSQTSSLRTVKRLHMIGVVMILQECRSKVNDVNVVEVLIDSED